MTRMCEPTTTRTDAAARGLVLDTVSISLGETCLVDLTCTVTPGDVVTIVGESGSGKSTLLACIGGFLDPIFTASGRILLNGTDITRVPARERRLGLMFQDDLLFPHLSVRGNLLFAIPADVARRRDRVAIAEAALEDVGLAGFGSRDPATLSGGQRSRVALMRTLLSKPRALLLDEPFSKLDPERRGRIRSLVFAKARREELPVLLVTHDESDAKAAGGPILSL
ncbi:MAG: ATP-binding cassette domain-containing protein [Pseudomonadota bacterium]